MLLVISNWLEPTNAEHIKQDLIVDDFVRFENIAFGNALSFVAIRLQLPLAVSMCCWIGLIQSTLYWTRR